MSEGTAYLYGVLVGIALGMVLALTFFMEAPR